VGILDGKVAIITGAGRGIGREHALLFAKEGAAVVVNDLGGDGRGDGQDLTPAQEVAREITAAGGKAAVNGANVANWKAAEELVTQAVDTFGQIDILVNNAGILRDRMSFNLAEDEWDAVIDVVLKGSFAPSHFAAAHWRQQAKSSGTPVGGAIVNTTSESGLYGNAGQANYAAAKAGLVSLSIVMARELERIGVRVNAIAPVAATRLLGTVMRAEEDAPKSGYDPMAAKEISPLVAWLCSDLAKDVNGQVFAVNGQRIQRVGGHHPVTEVTSGQQSWTIEGIEAQRSALLGPGSAWTPPFLPPFEGGG
jgi:NAD(P)-dependent dehydrogenase (short-subunit alcohol dehydrogenase family)